MAAAHRGASRIIAEVTVTHQADTAICCSSGGIRSATYCLGAMQALAADGGMREVDLVTAVSGGSYIAAAWALQALAAADGDSASGDPASGDPASGDPASGTAYRAAYQQAFRPGSAEESRLRDHTHYLVPNLA